MAAGWKPAFALLTACFAAAASSVDTHRVRAPIILVPGLGGSVLESKLTNVTQPSALCSTDHDWEVEWVTPQTAALVPCLLNNLIINYNVTTGKYQNQTGVEIRPYKFGGLGGVAALDPQLPLVSGYFADLIDALKDKGYQESEDLFGAPYDFRLAADGLAQIGWYKRFQNLIEEAVAKNHGMPAVLVTHSMGGLVTKYFLDLMAQSSWEPFTDWTRRHIAGFIAIAAPWDGAVSALKGQISGDPFDLPLPHALIRPVQKTSPSGPWLFPRAVVWGDAVLVNTTGGDVYTSRDAAQLLADLGLHQQSIVLPVVSELIQPLLPLKMPVHCLYGTETDTDEAYVYDVPRFTTTTPPAPKTIISGPGDGTVNLRSLHACDRLGPQVKQHIFPNATHLGILSEDRVIHLIIHLARQLVPGDNPILAKRSSHRKHAQFQLSQTVKKLIQLD